MHYLTDTQTFPALGQYHVEILTDEQASEWLFEKQPPVSFLYQPRLQELLCTLTSFNVQEHADRSKARVSRLSPQTGDQFLSCYVEVDTEENAPKWFELTWQEQMERFCFRLITCLHRYGDDELLPSLPLFARAYVTPPPRRVVIGEPTLPGIGYFNFQAMSLELAQQWLVNPFRSRMRLGKQALALEMLTGTRVTSNFKPFEPLQRSCDQALVFYSGPRSEGLLARTIRAEVMVKKFDLALITWIQAEEALSSLQ